MKRTSIEEGLVIGTAGPRARVRLPRNDSCRTCGLCLFGRAGRDMIIEAENTAGAVAGEIVEVEIEREDPLGAALLLFGAPLAALLFGSAIGYLSAGLLGADRNGGAVLLGALLLAGTFFAVHRRELRQRTGAEAAVFVNRVVTPVSRSSDQPIPESDNGANTDRWPAE